MAVTTEDVKKLREESGAGMLDCKKALEETKGDYEKARTLLRERGFASAQKRAERETAEGMVQAYIHHNSRVGALVEINCESDFVARTEDFKNLVQTVVLQVAGADPQYLSAEDIPAGSEDDPKEVALLSQQLLRDDSRTVQDLLTETIAKTGENIRIKRFARFELGR